MGIRWELVEKGEEIEVRTEGIIAGVVKVDREKWRVVGVYVNRDREEKLQCLRGWMEEREKVGRTLIGGDFNARTGEKGGGIVEEGMRGKEEERSED